ncbi:MAG TPA: regulatory iron-sulfur-containing complex subunit RicT, partial [Phycisphaerales bacterium]|nr:regulatory iron-sulfur-containing complex subunit RicT [Phycisphaerales bacterium]
MPIHPLPQFEADLEADRRTYEALSTPRTLVVRFGVMKLVGEFVNESGAKPGCGSKLVIRTHRGTEIGEMLTSTCPNSGCSKSVTRKQMLEYVENSGGRDYPFFQEGRVLRVATAQDMDRQNQIDQSRHGLRLQARSVVEEMNLPIRVADTEPLLGGERLFIYFTCEERVDLRDFGPRLARLFQNRVELRQVGARDEARITADYERCGQYCCCKNFLKVLKPISMKSAKIQKATLDPLKISGRCGRLMCCLRYEDETYESLRKRLPRKKSRVGTPDGDGTVIDGQILTQLVLVHLDVPEADGKIRQVAYPVENLTDPISSTPPPPPPPFEPRRYGRPGSGPAPTATTGSAGQRTRSEHPASRHEPRPESQRPATRK